MVCLILKGGSLAQQVTLFYRIFKYCNNYIYFLVWAPLHTSSNFSHKPIFNFQQAL